MPTPDTSTGADGVRRISPSGLESYHANGFLVVPDVLPVGEVEGIDREIDRLLPDHGSMAEHTKGWVFGLHSELEERVATDPRILALIEDIVAPGIGIHSVKLVAKLPRSTDVCYWHQDEAFYLRPDDPATVSRTRMSVWIPLHDSDENNGCLWVVPGSHSWGLQPYVVVDHGTCRRRLTKEEYAAAHAVPVPVRAGSVVLFSAWLWHHSKNNATDHVRRAFITSYQEADVRSERSEWQVVRPASATT